jgi:hypothetical protein
MITYSYESQGCTICTLNTTESGKCDFGLKIVSKRNIEAIVQFVTEILEHLHEISYECMIKIMQFNRNNRNKHSNFSIFLNAFSECIICSAIERSPEIYQCI